MAGARRIGNLTLGGRPHVVAAGGEAEIDALVAADGADLVELRADLFTDPTPEIVVRALTRLRSAGRPIILTVRSAAEGGRPLADDRRRALYDAGLPLADAVDVEIASGALVAALVPRAHAAGRTVLLSAHFLDATPALATLTGLIAEARARGADLPKLAAHARHLDDVRTLLAATLAASAAGVVTMAMGTVGALSRVFFPAAGSLLTYAAVGQPTAPGQLSLAELTPLLARFYPA